MVAFSSLSQVKKQPLMALGGYLPLTGRHGSDAIQQVMMKFALQFW
jgi:hypothetical protein